MGSPHIIVSHYKYLRIFLNGHRRGRLEDTMERTLVLDKLREIRIAKLKPLYPA